MSIDPGSSARPLIDNEIPAYRALSALAVSSVIFGLASILTFVSGWFALLGALAVLFGVMALRKIRLFPEIVTGERVANVGIGMGLLFSLSALTLSGVQDFIIVRAASRFAREYEGVLRDGSLEDNIFYQAFPASRQGKTSQAIVQEMEKGSPSRASFEQQQAGLNLLRKRLAVGGQSVRFVEIASHGVDRMRFSGLAIYEVKGPTSKDFPAESQKAAVVIEGQTDVPGHDWYITNVQFPWVDPRQPR